MPQKKTKKSASGQEWTGNGGKNKYSYLNFLRSVSDKEKWSCREEKNLFSLPSPHPAPFREKRRILFKKVSGVQSNVNVYLFIHMENTAF
jgi:hypothetical protein